MASRRGLAFCPPRAGAAGFDAALGDLQGLRGGADGGFRFAADLGHAFGAGARRVEGAFARVEREVERRAVVALGGHLARFSSAATAAPYSSGA